MILPVQLKQEHAAAATAAAWFLPGDSVGQWLAELAISGLAELDTRLFLVPRSAADQTAAGLLVIPGPAWRGSPLPAAIPCQSLADRLYLPLDAALHPAVTDLEIKSLAPGAVAFFHPAFGLSGFETGQATSITDLLDLSPEREANWNFARAGSPPLPELNAIVLAEPPALENLFGESPEEIGIEPPVDLPPAPDEPKSDVWAKSRRSLRRIIAKGAKGAMKAVARGGPRRAWLNSIEDWADLQLRGVSEQLARLRDKELHRLLHLLDTDPESGLRHAIPLSGFAHRGVSPPGSRLGPRSPDFDPHRIGGRRADFWSVPLDLQEVLRRRYREMADREMQLGRHRRAAYIYAELLGDLVSAAHALRQGRWYREAAVLYETQLKNPREAARCLAQGGLLAEAILIFERVELWLEAADLYERLGNQTAAETAVRRVVSERMTQDDVLGAAKLVDERLRATDEALAMLAGAWPASRQAAGCAETLFQLLGRLGRHEAALERLIRFRREPVPERLVMPLLAALAGPAREFPHSAVRRQAADFSRVLVARELARPRLTIEDTGRLAEFLVRLAPDDRLLLRDANRHLEERRTAALRVARATTPPVRGDQAVLHRRLELPRQIKWLRLRQEWHWFFALGVTPNRLTLLRGVWDGEFQSLSWDCPAEAVDHGFVFEPTAEQGRAVALARLGGAPFAQKRFPALDSLYARECLAGTPTWLPTQGFPFAISEDAVWAVHVASTRAVLCCHDKRLGELQRSIDITEDLLGDGERGESTRLCLAVLANGVAVGLGNRLVVSRGDGRLRRMALPGQIVRLIPSLPHTRQGLAVLLDQGAVFHWLGTDDLIGLDHDLASPMGAFVPGGPLVLVSEFQALLLDVDHRGVRSVARMKLAGQKPMDVSATDSVKEFAVLGERGELTIYRMPTS